MMGVWILYDEQVDRAILYDSVTESPLVGTMFVGAQARDQADSFLAYLHTHHHRGHHGMKGFADPRRYSEEELRAAWARWYELTDAQSGRMNDYGWDLANWQIGIPAYGEPRSEPPEPQLVPDDHSGSRRADP